MEGPVHGAFSSVRKTKLRGVQGEMGKRSPKLRVGLSQVGSNAAQQCFGRLC
jgi:hypothetical protein